MQGRSCFNVLSRYFESYVIKKNANVAPYRFYSPWYSVHLVLPNRRDRLVAARAGILPSRSTMQAMNRLWVYRIY
ncbi:hypothetical protein FQF87_22560 [Escherichia coli]|nr:hypothetical protein [Escherichia coli]